MGFNMGYNVGFNMDFNDPPTECQSLIEHSLDRNLIFRNCRS
jgi:hypothetical protein